MNRTIAAASVLAAVIAMGLGQPAQAPIKGAQASVFVYDPIIGMDKYDLPVKASACWEPLEQRPKDVYFRTVRCGWGLVKY